MQYLIFKYALGNSYESAREEFCHILDHTKRASSLVENLNSRIRVYMNLKRHRSRIAERIGKSPLELMTGKEYPEFLEVLGY